MAPEVVALAEMAPRHQLLAPEKRRNPALIKCFGRRGFTARDIRTDRVLVSYNLDEGDGLMDVIATDRGSLI